MEELMALSGQAPAVSKKRAVAAWLAAELVFLTAWFLFAAALLALSTFLPPRFSALGLGSVFIISVALSSWFSRRAPVRDGLKSLREDSGQTRLRSFGRLGRALLAPAAISAIIISCTHAVWHWRVLAFKQSLKKEGLPVTLSDLQENLPDEEYAYPSLWNAMEKEFDWEFYKKIRYGDDINDKGASEIFKEKPGYAAHFTLYLDKKLPALLAKKYTRYRKVDYAHAPKNPYQIPIPQFHYFYGSSRTAGLYAVLLASRGDTAKAWALTGLQLDLADLLSNDKDLSSKLVVSLIRRQAADTALYILLNSPAAVIPPDLIPRFKGVLSDHLVSDGLKYELAFDFDSYAYLESGGGKLYVSWDDIYSDTDLEWGFKQRSDFRLWFDYKVFLLLRSMGTLDINSLAEARCFSALTTKGAWPQMTLLNNYNCVAIESLPSWPYYLAKMRPMSAYFRLHTEEWEIKAWTQLALACSELGRYRTARGRYPEKITELVPKSFSAELFKDVFTGGELSYVPAGDGKGFTLCSFGPNGDKKDRSGKELCVRRKP